MMTKDKILTVIPARIGSIRVSQKNIKLINGKPLIHYILTAAKNAELVEDIVISTDSEEIAKLAVRYGVWHMMRPESLCRDDTLIVEVLHHVMLTTLNGWGVKYDAFLSLQATSPLLTSETIDKVIDKFRTKSCTAVATVTRVRNNRHPHILKKMIMNDCIVQALPETINAVPQYPSAFRNHSVYYCNGAAFLRHRSLLLDLDLRSNALGYGFLGVEMDEEEAININTQLDFDIAEFLLQRKEHAN